MSGLEVTVRVWGYSERHIYDPIYMPFTLSDEIPYIHKPNLALARARGLAIINTDGLGLRAMNVGSTYGAKQANEYRIAIVGDSCTFGEGVPRTQDTFAQVLEDTLNRRQQAVTVKVLNYGASAYSVKEMASSLEYRMMDVQPDLVVFAMIPADLNTLRTPGVDAVGYLVDRRVPFLHDSLLREILRSIHLMYVLREIVLGLTYRADDDGPSHSLEHGAIPESYRYVQRFKTLANQRQVPHLVVLLPTRNSRWGLFVSQLTQDGITYLDLSYLYREFSREQFAASRFDPHPSPAVHHRIGESLADYILRQQAFTP